MQLIGSVDNRDEFAGFDERLQVCQAFVGPLGNQAERPALAGDRPPEAHEQELEDSQHGTADHGIGSPRSQRALVIEHGPLSLAVKNQVVAFSGCREIVLRIIDNVVCANRANDIQLM